MSATAFRPTSPADYPALSRFLAHVFGADAGGSLVRADHVQWKYWAEHPEWDGSRSYVLERRGEIIAHGAIWPLTILTTAGPIPAVQLYDWAADASQVGAGFVLLRHVAKLRDVICSIGGSETTQRMRVPMGFRPRNAVHWFSRTTRPVREALAQPLSWKTPLRAARAAGRSWPLPKPSAGWDAREVSPADFAGPDVPFPAPRGAELVFEQSAARLAFLARCPTVRFRFYVVRRGGVPAGYFVMRYEPAEARIIDAWVRSDDEHGWAELYALAVRSALRDSTSPTLASYAPTECVRRGLTVAGFRSTFEQHVHVYDPRGRVAEDASLFLQLAHTDYAFI